MNKICIVLLSSFIACSSWAMDDHIKRDIAGYVKTFRHFRPDVSALYDNVQSEVQSLKKADQLTPETLLPKIKAVLGRGGSSSCPLPRINVFHFSVIFRAITHRIFQTKALDSIVIKRDGTQCALIEKDNLTVSVWNAKSPKELIPLGTFIKPIQEICWIDGDGRLLVFVKDKEYQCRPYQFNGVGMDPARVSEMEVRAAMREMPSRWKINSDEDDDGLQHRFPTMGSGRDRTFLTKYSSKSESTTITVEDVPSLDEIAHYLCAQEKMGDKTQNKINF
jgi:hypothetical protein